MKCNQLRMVRRGGRYSLLYRLWANWSVVLEENVTSLWLAVDLFHLQSLISISNDLRLYSLGIVEPQVFSSSKISYKMFNSLIVPVSGLAPIASQYAKYTRDVQAGVSHKVQQCSNCYEVLLSVHFILLLLAKLVEVVPCFVLSNRGADMGIVSDMLKLLINFLV